MEHLYAPWRQKYFDEKRTICPFCACTQKLESDESLGVIFRAKYSFAVMNRYPYSPGHFMIIPYTHTENIEDLEAKVWQEMSELVRFGVKVLKAEFHASGVNIGMNLGSTAGAGIAAHCHYHLVPRFKADTNFITTIANTRVYGTQVDEVYKKLYTAFKDFDAEQG